MNKIAAFVLSLAFCTGICTAQSQSEREPRTDDLDRETTAEPSAEVTFTNRSGDTYTVSELGDELRDLREAIDRTMPILTAFNQNFGTNTGQQTVAGALSSILSGVLGAKQTNSAAGGSANDFETVVEGLLGTNASAAATYQVAAQQLLALQNQLQPVGPILDKLNIGDTNSAASDEEVIGRTPRTREGAERPPEPTGRRDRGATTNTP